MYQGLHSLDFTNYTPQYISKDFFKKKSLLESSEVAYFKYQILKIQMFNLQINF